VLAGLGEWRGPGANGAGNSGKNFTSAAIAGAAGLTRRCARQPKGRRHDALTQAMPGVAWHNSCYLTVAHDI